MYDCPLNLPAFCNPADLATAGRSLAAPYVVTSIASDRWQLSSPYGDNLNVYRSRKAAVTAGRLLAGWRGHVVVTAKSGR